MKTADGEKNLRSAALMEWKGDAAVMKRCGLKEMNSL